MHRTLLALLTCCAAYGQTFEVASIKPASPPVPDGRGRIMIAGPSGGPGSKDPGRIRYPFINLRTLIMNAYDVKSFQIDGPAFLDTERFELNATMPPETTKEQFKVMLQNLLAERFKLAVHKDTRELPMYSLIVNKGGPKMKESEPAAQPKDDDGPPAPPPLPNGPPKMGPDGFPILPPPMGGRPGLFMMMMPGRARLTGQQQTMKDLADRLTSQLSRPVTDATELTAKYDFVLSFSTENLPSGMGPLGMMPPPPPPPGGGAGNPDTTFRPESEAPPDIFRALQSQLGLKLESKKGSVEMIVVEHVEKTPTDN